jgi:hypothetical protein
MAELEYPLINGRAHDGSSVKIRLLGTYWRGFQAITYGDGISPNYVYELGSTVPIAKTRGQYAPEDMALEILRERADAIRAAAAAVNKDLADLDFQILVHMQESTGAVSTDLISGAGITKIGNEAKAGGDALIEKWTVKPMLVKRNGTFLRRR